MHLENQLAAAHSSVKELFFDWFETLDSEHQRCAAEKLKQIMDLLMLKFDDSGISAGVTIHSGRSSIQPSFEIQQARNEPLLLTDYAEAMEPFDAISCYNGVSEDTLPLPEVCFLEEVELSEQGSGRSETESCDVGSSQIVEDSRGIVRQ